MPTPTDEFIRNAQQHTHESLCREAIEVQDAVNLRAIARLLVRAADFSADHRGGTQASYDDPAVILIVNKIESLVRSEQHSRYSRAYDYCRQYMPGYQE